MPVYSSGSRPAWSPSRVFRLAYFDARPEARIQAVYDGRCPRDEAAQEEEEAAALLVRTQHLSSRAWYENVRFAAQLAGAQHAAKRSASHAYE